MPVLPLQGECAILSCFPALLINDAAMIISAVLVVAIRLLSHSLLLEPAKSVKEVLISILGQLFYNKIPKEH